MWGEEPILATPLPEVSCPMAVVEPGLIEPGTPEALAQLVGVDMVTQNQSEQCTL